MSCYITVYPNDFSHFSMSIFYENLVTKDKTKEIVNDTSSISGVCPIYYNRSRSMTVLQLIRLETHILTQHSPASLLSAHPKIHCFFFIKTPLRKLFRKSDILSNCILFDCLETLRFFLPGAVLHCLCKRWLSRLLITEQQPSSSSSVHQHKLCCVQPTQHLSCEALNRFLMYHVNNKNN